MSISMNTGLTSVTGSVNAVNTPAATQTLIMKYLNSANDATTIYTVTAGKTFYCNNVRLENQWSGGAGTIGLTVNGSTWLSYAVTASPSNASIIQLNSPMPLFSCPTTGIIRLDQSMGAGRGGVVISGWEQ